MARENNVTQKKGKKNKVQPPVTEIKRSSKDKDSVSAGLDEALFSEGSVESQVVALKQLPAAQRQTAAGKMGEVQGNRHVQRVVTDMHNGNSSTSNVQAKARTGPTPTATVQPKLTVGESNDAYEQEADQVAETVMKMPAAATPPPPNDDDDDTPLHRSTLTTPIQAKLNVGAVDDPFEKEADQVAETVMRMPDPSPTTDAEDTVQRSPLGIVSRYVQRATLQASSVAGAEGGPVDSSMENTIGSLRGGGRPLPKTERDFFEPRMNVDLGGVKVHTGETAMQSAKDLNARAYTIGSDVVFNSGEYQPGTTAGRQLMAHELTHVVQQGSAGELQRKPETLQRTMAVETKIPAAEVDVEIPAETEEELKALNFDGGEDKTKDPGTEDTSSDSGPKPDGEPPEGEDSEKPEGENTENEAQTEAEGSGGEQTAGEDADAEQTEGEDSKAEGANEEETTAEGEEEEEGAAEGDGNSSPEAGAAQDAKDAAQTEADGATEESQTQSESQISEAESETATAAAGQQETAVEGQAAQTSLSESQTTIQETESEGFAPSPSTGGGGLAHVLGYLGVDTAPIEAKKQEDEAQAAQQLDAFVAENSGQAATITELAQVAQNRIDPVKQAAITAVDTAVTENIALVTDTINQTRTQAEAEAATTVGEISTQYDNTIAELEATTQTAIGELDAEHSNKLTALDTLESGKTGDINSAFTSAVADVERIAQVSADTAKSVGESKKAIYQQESYPEPSFTDGSDYYERKRKAKIDAAEKVATGYADEFKAKGEETKSQLSGGSSEVVTELQTKISSSRQAIESEYASAAASLEQALQQSLASAADTKTTQLDSVDSSLQATLATLNTLGSSKTAEIEQSGETQKATIESNAAELLASIQASVAEGAQGLATALQDVSAQLSSIPAPKPADLEPIIAQANAQLAALYTQTEVGIEQQITTAETTVTQVGEQSVTAIGTLGQAAVGEITPIGEGFTESSSELVSSATQSFQDLSTSHSESTEAQKQSTLTNFDAAYTQAEQDTTEIVTCLETGLAQFASEFEAGLQPSLTEEPGKIDEEASKAADKVQPAWKKIVAFIAIIIISVIVAVVITALVMSGIGLGLGLLLAAGIGALGGVAKGMINNWATGEEIFKDFWKNAALGALDGMLQFAGGRFIKGLGLPQTGLKKIVVEQAVNMASGIVNDVASLALSGKLTWENVGKSLLNNLVKGVVGVGTGRLTQSFGLPDGSVKKALADMGMGTLGDTISNMTNTFLIEGKEFTYSKALQILGESTAENVIKGGVQFGLNQADFTNRLTNQIDEMAGVNSEANANTNTGNNPTEDDESVTTPVPVEDDETTTTRTEDDDVTTTPTTDTDAPKKSGATIAGDRGYDDAPDGYHWSRNGDDVILKRNPGKANNPDYPPLEYDTDSKSFVAKGTQTVRNQLADIGVDNTHATALINNLGSSKEVNRFINRFDNDYEGTNDFNKALTACGGDVDALMTRVNEIDAFTTSISGMPCTLMSGKTPAFWTGPGSGDAAAASNALTTMTEDTQVGQAVGAFANTTGDFPWEGFNKKLWVESSERYANEVASLYGTGGAFEGQPIYAVVSPSANPKSIYFEYEKPILQAAGVNIIEVSPSDVPD